MGKKIFISYKYADRNVENLKILENSTVRNYVDEIMENYLDDSDIYKGEEDDNDLSQFKDETIENNLKDKIHDSSIIIVLISPHMKTRELENDQWIPWEISYSLKKIKRGEKTSQSNGIVAVILPDANGSYEYFIKDASCGPNCCICYQTQKTFDIIRNNRHNKHGGASSKCPKSGSKVFTSNDSYIELVKWDAFIKSPQKYINNAEEKRKNIKQYDIQKEV